MRRLEEEKLALPLLRYLRRYSRRSEIPRSSSATRQAIGRTATWNLATHWAMGNRYSFCTDRTARRLSLTSVIAPSFSTQALANLDISFSPHSGTGGCARIKNRTWRRKAFLSAAGCPYFPLRAMAAMSIELQHSQDPQLLSTVFPAARFHPGRPGPNGLSALWQPKSREPTAEATCCSMATFSDCAIFIPCVTNGPVLTTCSLKSSPRTTLLSCQQTMDWTSFPTRRNGKCGNMRCRISVTFDNRCSPIL